MKKIQLFFIFFIFFRGILIFMANKIYEVIEMKKKILLIVVGIISGLLFSCKDVKALTDDSYLETNYTGVWAYHYKNGNLVTYGGLPFR